MSLSVDVGLLMSNVKHHPDGTRDYPAHWTMGRTLCKILRSAQAPWALIDIGQGTRCHSKGRRHGRSSSRQLKKSKQKETACQARQRCPNFQGQQGYEVAMSNHVDRTRWTCLIGEKGHAGIYAERSVPEDAERGCDLCQRRAERPGFQGLQQLNCVMK